MSRTYDDWRTCDDPGPALVAALDRVRERTPTRTTLDRWHLDLYGGLSYQGYSRASATVMVPELDDSICVENVIRQVADTIAAKILRDDIEPRVLTTAGDFEQRKRARNLSQWLSGALREFRVHEDLLPVEVIHALITGTGLLYVWHDGRDLVVEVQPPWECHVDPSETMRSGQPRTMYRERVVPRAELEALYPDTEIPQDAGWSTSQQVVDPYEYGDDCARVIEGWHVGRGDKPGRYVMSVGGSVVVDEEWPGEHLPFVALRYKRRPVGYWGQGLVEDLAGAQVTLASAQQARLDDIAKTRPFVVSQRGSGVVVSHLLSDEGLRLVEYAGAKPEVIVPNGVSPGLSTLIVEMKQQMYAMGGTSEGSATMQRAALGDSGKAMRTYHDIESERLSQFSKAVESFVVDLCYALIRAAQDLALTSGEVPDVLSVAKGSTHEIAWADVGTAEDRYVLQVTPASSLATTLSGRLADVQEMLKAGIITDPARARELLRLPDVERDNEIALAQSTLLEMVIEQEILDEGKPWTPEPTWDLGLAQKLSTSYLVWAELNKYPEDRLALLRAFLAQVQALIKQATPQPNPALPGAPGAGPIPAGVESANVPSATGFEPGPIAGGGVVPLG